MTDKMREEFEKNYQRALTQVRYDQETDTFVPKRRGNYANEEFARILHGAWQAWKLAWQAARTVPDEAVSILADVIRELENGFVRCETCGDQEDTATLDCMDELRRVHYMLSAAPEPKK